ncbi:hypothetical protein MM300_20600 [Evansella sp. LMS18]|uniref:hypothetical protein n=1 Tax=Evansella sp. LMS18 TaxID=2924033 RepID=UPI0020D0B7E3|nr:hypothetical protein [Evansella sp. LMS18]UTR10247.1 hypothetical protein MM300_20600 [Evansella sp. LMS18]
MARIKEILTIFLGAAMLFFITTATNSLGIYAVKVFGKGYSKERFWIPYAVCCLLTGAMLFFLNRITVEYMLLEIISFSILVFGLISLLYLIALLTLKRKRSNWHQKFSKQLDQWEAEMRENFKHGP